MGSRSLAIAVAILPWLPAEAGVSFTPREVNYRVEGITFNQLSFSEAGAPDVTYQQPPGWRFSGSPAKLTLQPPDRIQAEGLVTAVPLSAPASFDEAETKSLLTQALGLVPEGSTNVTVVSQEHDPVKIGGKETFLVILAYTQNGENYMRSVIFMNRKNEQIRFQFISRTGDFEELNRVFLSSLCSWQNL